MSLYKVQRRLGYVWMRFLPQVEAEYRVSRSPAAKRRARALAIILGGSILAFLVLSSLVQPGALPPQALTLYGCAIGFCACTVLVSLLGWTGARIETLLQVPLVGTGLCYVGGLLLSSSAGAMVPQGGLLAMLMGVYFTSGMTLYRSVACGLLFSATLVIGAIALKVERPAFTIEVLHLVMTNVVGMIGAYHIETELRRSFLLRMELQNLALLDSLTGLLNRRAFSRHLHNVWRQAKREHKTVGMLVLDIDHFKLVNDHHGHLAGDRCLKAVARVLGENLRRPLDSAARFGGDEFASLWYDVDEDWFRRLAENVRSACESANRRGNLVPFTVSVGAAMAEPQIGWNANHLLRFADENLYKVKNSTRNGVHYARFVHD